MQYGSYCIVGPAEIICGLDEETHKEYEENARETGYWDIYGEHRFTPLYNCDNCDLAIVSLSNISWLSGYRAVHEECPSLDSDSPNG